MKATRVPLATNAALAALLTLACACTACSAPAPPPPDAISRNEPLPTAPVATEPALETPVDKPVEGTPAQPVRSQKPPGASTPAVKVPPPRPTPPTINKPSVKPIPSPAAPAAGSDAATPTHLTIESLSRGKGVPAGTREAFKQIRALLERQQATAAVTALQYQRIGLEGESRLCVEFRNASDAQSALAEIRRIAADADLLNVVEAPCPSKKE